MGVEDISDGDLLAILYGASTAVRVALDGLDDWGLAGTVDWQYRHDLIADAAALGVLRAAGVGVLSEESGEHGPMSGVVVVLDPVDGSTNASRGLPWFNTSLCALDAEGPRVSVVVNQATGARFEAVRGGGARLDGRPIAPTACRQTSTAIVGLNGWPPCHLGWKQYRALGATALDLCAVAAGMLDGYVDCTTSGAAPWDYLGAMLVCTEAGALVADARGDQLVTRGHDDRRVPVAAGTPELLAELLERRRTFA